MQPPTAFEFIPGMSGAAFVFCDHASNHIPAEMERLGLSRADLDRHIAHDIGAAGVTRTLCARLGCAGLLATHSRLLVDLNRAEDAPGLIPEASDTTPIPGNRNLSEDARARRLRRFYHPYHAELSRRLEARPDTFAVSVHSFTPEPRGGTRRALDIGLLAKHDAHGGDWSSAERFLAALAPHGLNTAINAPYSAYDLNHTVDAHVVPRGLRHLGIEIRQDHIATPAGVRVFAHWIADAISQIL